jgi:lambda family phage tail tape measure protein
MAANLNYNVNVNTTAGVQALNNLQTKVGSVTDSFSKFKNVLGGLAIGSIVGNLLKFADNIKDLSEATGIATSNILGFQKAVQAAGGSADGADKAILKLVTNIGEAAQGSGELQGAFLKVGVSLNDLATLSETDILRKTIEGLGSITDKSTQAALKAQLLGKEFRGVATAGLAEAFDNYSRASEGYAASIDKAAAAQDQLDKATNALKLALLDVIAPLAEFVNKLDPIKLSDFMKTALELTAVIIGFRVFVTAATAVTELAVALGLASTAAGGTALSIISNFGLIGKVIAGLSVAVLGLKAVFPETFKAITDSIGGAYDKLKGFLGFANENKKALEESTAGAGRGGNAEITKLLQERGNLLAKESEAVRAVSDAYDKFKNSITGVVDSYADSNAKMRDAITLNTQLIGLSSQQVEKRKAEAEISGRAAEEIKKLEDRKRSLSEYEKDRGGVALIDQQIAKIKEQAQADIALTNAAITNSEARKAAYALEVFQRRSSLEVEKELKEVQDQMATMTMTTMEKKSYQIKANAEARAKAEIAAEEARRGSLMTDAEKQKYMDASLKGSEELVRKNKELYDQSRTFETGWKNAFNEYVEDATNAAKQAESLFKKTTQGMEDLIVNFVKTGKFEWKGFVNSIAEDLLRSNLKQIIAGVFGGATGDGLGGVLSKLGNIFGVGGGGGADAGKGTSANNPMYVYDVAAGGARGGGGAMGGEGGLGGVWDSVKNAATTIWDGVKNVGSGIYDAVEGVVDSIGGIFSGGGGDSGGGFFDSIASGIGSLFDGWFANGGQIGAGKFGIVGENGPEFVGGPATVTPMGGGSNVTYNINAVDAQSFKAMIAADPSFIHGVAMMGARSSPARR